MNSLLRQAIFIALLGTLYLQHGRRRNQSIQSNRGQRFFIKSVVAFSCVALELGAIENELTNSLIWTSSDYAIELVNSSIDEINNNSLLENSDTGIRLNYSSDNQSIGNNLKRGLAGITIHADEGTNNCESTNATVSARNDFENTSAFEFDRSMVLGISSLTWPRVYYNSIISKEVYDNNIGVFFNEEHG
jgi:parallel beta-helix repeat protein